MSDETQHAAIVHRLRMAGWDRWDAFDEADRKMAERATLEMHDAAKIELSQRPRRFTAALQEAPHEHD